MYNPYTEGGIDRERSGCIFSSFRWHKAYGTGEKDQEVDAIQRKPVAIWFIA